MAPCLLSSTLASFTGLAPYSLSDFIDRQNISQWLPDLGLCFRRWSSQSVEIYGPESSGETTLALHAIAEVQRLGGNAMLVEDEHAFDPSYSKSLRVDIEIQIVCQPDNGEMALEIADRICRSGAVDLICIDSVSALTPRETEVKEIGMQQTGLQARLMSQALRKMSGNASKAGFTLIFLNQIRHKIGVFYGNPEVTSGRLL